MGGANSSVFGGIFGQEPDIRGLTGAGAVESGPAQFPVLLRCTMLGVGPSGFLRSLELHCSVQSYPNSVERNPLAGRQLLGGLAGPEPFQQAYRIGFHNALLYADRRPDGSRQCKDLSCARRFDVDYFV